MVVRRILRYPDPRLQRRCRPVEQFDDELQVLVQDLLETGWHAPGLGVAAPQVGVNLALAVIDLSVGEDPEAPIVLANPEIVETVGKVTVEEGCLSFPGLYTSFVRPRWLRVSAQDLSGMRREIEAEGLLAQAVCHEVDHLNGVLLVDHLRGLKRNMFLKKVKKAAGAW